MSRIGEIVAGRYRIEERIGAGAMGEVFRASACDGSEADVAIKILRPERAREREAVERFLAEVRAMRTLAHRSIVRVISEGETKDRVPFVVMELLRGEALRTILQRHGRVDRATALSLIVPVLEALEAAHAHGVVHRDVKPENVHLSTNDKGVAAVKVLDFGIAKVLDAALAIGHKTTAGIVVGTPGYFSPEQASGDREIDGRADLFAVGAILFELLTGRRAFEGRSPVIAAWKVVSEPAPRLADSGVDNAADLQTVLDHALAKKMKNRFASARAFLDAVEPLAPSEIGRHVLLSSLLASAPPSPPVAAVPSVLSNVQMSVVQSAVEPAPTFLATMKSTRDPLAERNSAREGPPKRAVRLAEEPSSSGVASLVPASALVVSFTLDDDEAVAPTPVASAAAMPLSRLLPMSSRGKFRARAGWIRSIINSLERVRSVAEVSNWIDALPVAFATAVRVALLEPDAWAPFDALHALVAIATERAFYGDPSGWRAHVQNYGSDLAARVDGWSTAGPLDTNDGESFATWWPIARAAFVEVGDVSIESVSAGLTACSVDVHVRNVESVSRALRHAELGLIEAIFARAGFASVRAAPLSGDDEFGQEFRYRVTWR